MYIYWIHPSLNVNNQFPLILVIIWTVNIY